MKYWNCTKAVLTIFLKHKYTRGGTADGDFHLNCINVIAVIGYMQTNVDV